MLLVDWEIKCLCTPNEKILSEYKYYAPNRHEYFDKPMIEPFSEAVSGNGIISYGLSSCGYDLRMGQEVLIFKNTSGEAVDPKKFKDKDYQHRMFDKIIRSQGEPITIPAHGYILAESFEYLRIPRHLAGRCIGKSTYARSGIIVNCTPLEPQWEGHLTIEISNSCPCPAIVYCLEGIAQLQFELLNSGVKVSYADKSGQYQAQVGVTPPRVK